MDGVPQAAPGPVTPANTAAPPAQPAISAWSPATLSNIAALFVCLWMAIGLTSEIVTRNEDYGRVLAHQKGLIACQTGTAPPGTNCPRSDPNEYKDARPEALEAAIKKADANAVAFWVEVSAEQVRRYDSLNSRGAPDRCHVAAVIASQIGHFWEDCQTVRTANLENVNIDDVVKEQRAYLKAVAQAKADGQPEPAEPGLRMFKPENRTLIKTMLLPSPLNLRLDEWPKEPLYFWLVVVSAAIGSLIAGLRNSAITIHRDVTLGIGAGFAVYILLRGGNFVFFTGGAALDILNPFTASAVGLLVGLFNDKAFGLLGNAMPAVLARAGQPAAANPDAVKKAELAQTNAVNAATKTHEALVEALKKTQPGTDAHKALQETAITALEAKAKAEEAAKAQGDAAKPG